MGLREQKKAKTRKKISDLATMLFIKKGYDAVTTAEIAEAAEVSVPTLFNYFPTKESLVFDEDKEREDQVVNCVLERKKGTSILQALEAVGLAALKPEELKYVREFHKLVENNPALAAYERSMWMRHEVALAKAIRKTGKIKVSQIEAEVIANFVLDGFHRSLKASDPKASLKKVLRLLEAGCGDL